MELESLLKLIDKVSESKLSHFNFEDGELTISMKKQNKEIVVTTSGEAAMIPMPAAQNIESGESGKNEVTSQGRQIKAPLVGTFYNAPSPDTEPYVKVGDMVKKGQTLGIIEAMKLMNEIECEYDGTVESILIENEQIVEYGQPIFVIK